MAEWVAQYWIQELFGLIVLMVGMYFKSVKKSIDKQICKFECRILEHEAIKCGMQALLRSEIVREYDKWMDEDKLYIPIYAMDNVNKLFKQYEELDGNGTIPGLVEELRNLPKKKPDNSKPQHMHRRVDDKQEEAI